MLLLLIMYIYIYTQEPVWNIVGESCLSPTSERYSENMTQSVDTVVVWCFFYLLCIYIYTQEPVWNIVGESCLAPTSERYSENMTQSVDTVVVWCFFYLLCIYIYIHTRTCVKHCGGKLSSPHFRTLQWKHDSKCRHCCGVMLLLLIMYIYIYTHKNLCETLWGKAV